MPGISFKLVGNSTVAFEHSNGCMEVTTINRLIEKGLIAEGSGAALRCCYRIMISAQRYVCFCFMTGDGMLEILLFEVCIDSSLA